MFFVLYKKHFLYWIRNWQGTLCQVLVPIILIGILSWLISIISKDKFPESSYEPIQFPTSTDPTKLPPGFDPEHFLKNCKDKESGGKVAFAPENTLTKQLANFFQLTTTDSIFFQNDQEIDDYILSEDYGEKYRNGTTKRICLAVSFDQYNEYEINYSYNLRFNISIPGEEDHFQTRYSNRKLPFKVDDPKVFAKSLQHGSLTLQILIDSFILKNHYHFFQTQEAFIQHMHTPYYEYKRVDLTESAVSFIILLSVLISFLREIGYMVIEKESRCIDNMTNMGVSKIIYYLASLFAVYTFQIFYGLMLSLFFSIKALIHTDFLVIFVLYITYSTIMNTIAYFLSNFFLSTKKAIIFAMVFQIALEVPYLMRDKWKELGAYSIKMSTISPIAGLGQIVYSILLAESNYIHFDFSLFQIEVAEYKAINYFIFMGYEFIGFFILGIYTFYVIPHEIGIASHPLFFLGFPFKKKEIKEESIEIKHIENFEQVSIDLQKQISENETISLRSLNKIFKNQTVAVNNVTLDFYNGQIFALLGHNGAGKTTTISMLSGTLQKTSGQISILGYNHAQNSKEIKKLMGICSQYNIIFDYLTVEEHLILYAHVKGVYGNIQKEIDEVLKDIDLFHKKKDQAKNLSGGQKRKLNVAIAFIGGSKVILLDEPTSGMDAYARRLLWDMIKKYKENRLILLTTHNMDEADYLGDRIAIMSKGEVMTCGSSLYLKKKWGAGYELTIVKKHPEKNPEEFTKKFLEICPKTKFLSDFGQEVKYKLFQEDSKDFDKLFREIENIETKENSEIQSFGISLTTLEEVFLKVSSIQHEEKIDQEEEQEQNESESLTESTLKIGFENKTACLHEIIYPSSFKILLMQILSLVKKRFIYFSRDLGGLSCEIFIPIALFLLGYGLTTLQFIYDPPLVKMDFSTYPFEFKINDLYKIQNMTQSFLDNIYPQNFNATVLESKSASEFDLNIFKKSSEKQNYSFYLKNFDIQSYSYNIFLNSTAPFATLSSTNILHNSFLKHFTKNKNAKIETNLKPLINTHGIKKLESTIDGFIMHSFIVFGYCFVAASMIVVIIKERENNAKHQQLISGVGIFAYWFSNFIVDYVKWLIPTFFYFGMFYVLDFEFYIEEDKGLMILCLFLIYGINAVLFIYFLSFLFKSIGKGQVFVFVLHYFLMMFLDALTFVLRIIPDTQNITFNYLEFIFRIFPPFSFSFAVLNLPNFRIYAAYFNWPTIPKAFEFHGCLWELIYLSATAVLLFFLVFLIEFSFKLTFLYKTRQKKKTNTPLDNLNEPLLVDKETQQKELLQWDIKINDLVKVYSSGFKKKIAVKGINLELKSGNIMGLLGTNGAGKTTTFKVLTGDIFPTSGNVYIKGKEMPQNILQIRKYLGYCPQFDTILDNLTAEEHLYLYAALKGIKRKYHKKLVDSMIKKMNLKDYRNIQAKNYSGGNKRKLTVAIAILGSPAIILLDEPSSGMDPESRRFMWSVINKLSVESKNSSILLTTHSMEEAEALSTHILIMVEGLIKAEGSVQQLKKNYGENYELDVKLNLPEIYYYEQMKEKFKEYSKKQLKIKDCVKILKKLDQEFLKEFLIDKNNSKILIQELELNGTIGFEQFLEWIYLVERFFQIEKILKHFFQASRIESFRAYASFKIPFNQKLSNIFNFMESDKQKLGIMNYNLKQISLEQIFMNFAHEAEHDELN